MSEEVSTKRRKRRGSGDTSDDALSVKLTKDEEAVAKFMRNKLCDKEGKLMGNVVTIFIASEALDLLMESKWATANPNNKKIPLLFPSRQHAINFMNTLLFKQLFHRAEKVKKKSRRKIEPASEVISNGNGKKSKKAKQLESKDAKNDDSQQQELESTSTDVNKSDEKVDQAGGDEDEEKEKERKKKEKNAGKKARMKLEMHDHQVFMDGDSIYVWIYNPVSAQNLILGILVLLAIVCCCLFPLWPDELRVGAYYLSLVVMGLLGVLLGLVVLRAVLFGGVWCATFGRHHFWFLPNLTEDCGVIESFKPLYSHEYKGTVVKTLKKD